MTPAIWAEKEDIEFKNKAYAVIAMTTHWSSQGQARMTSDGEYNEKLSIRRLPQIARQFRLSEQKQKQFDNRCFHTTFFQLQYIYKNRISLTAQLLLEMPHRIQNGIRVIRASLGSNNPSLSFLPNILLPGMHEDLACSYFGHISFNIITDYNLAALNYLAPI
jgi:hypothetical protein